MRTDLKILMAVASLWAWSAQARAVTANCNWGGANPGYVAATFEGEAGTLTSRMVTGAGGTGTAIHSTDSDTTWPASCGGGSGTVGCASFDFTPPYTADYKIYAYVNVDASSPGSHDSFWVNVQTTGGSSIADTCGNSGFYRWDLNDGSTSYRWGYVNPDIADNTETTANNARVWRLTAGTTYRIWFMGREDDTYLDKFQMLADWADLPPTATPSPTSTPPPALGTGLCGSYYLTTNWTGAVASTRTERPDITTSGPWPGISGLDIENYSAIWVGQIEFPYAGTYTINYTVDDGFALYINDMITPIINHAESSGVDTGSGTYDVTAPGKQDILIRFFIQGGTPGQIDLRWQNGSLVPLADIPANRLYPGSPCTGASSPTITRTPTISATSTRSPTPAATVPSPTRTSTITMTLQPTHTPVATHTALPTPNCTSVIFSGASLGENGNWSGANANRSIAIMPSGGTNSLKVDITATAGAYNNQIANLDGFSPTDWTGIVRVSLSVYVPSAPDTPWAAAAVYHRLRLRGASAAAGLTDAAMAAVDTVDLMPGMNNVSFAITNSGTMTPAGRAALDQVFFVLDTGVPANGTLYLDNITLHTGISCAASPTPSPTPQWYSGLPANNRLYGLEYIPFPARTGAFHDLSITFTASTTPLAGNNIPRNTARWRIELQGVSGLDASGMVQVETRIGPYGVTCTTGYVDSDIYSDALALTLPARPQNLSTTYLWNSASKQDVPVTERFDALGDPRYVPYMDVATSVTAETFAGNYNWYWRPLSEYTATGYGTWVPKAAGFYAGAVNEDVPKLFGLVREGVMVSNSIFNSMTGWSSYYIGTGGEIGGDANNKLNGGVPMDGRPYNSTSDSDRDDIIGDKVWVRTASWKSMPYIGELWPDSLYAQQWAYSASKDGSAIPWGNLINSNSTVSSVAGSAYRSTITNFDYGAAGTPTSYFPFDNCEHRTGPEGSASFMNGSSGTNNFNHYSVTDPVPPATNTNWMWDARMMANDYNFAVSPAFTMNRPWDMSSGASTPPEWSDTVYSNRRATLANYPTTSAGGVSATAGFYDASSATHRAAGAIRAYHNNSSGLIGITNTPVAGWFVVNGLMPSTESGIAYVARFSLLACLRVFMEAGVPVSATASSGGNPGGASFATNDHNRIGGSTVFRIPPIPYVQIYAPTLGAVDTRGVPTVTLRWRERYSRWDGLKYTEKYPCVDNGIGTNPSGAPCVDSNTAAEPDPMREWHEPEALNFNIKYSTDSAHWYSALTGLTATAGVYMDGADSIPYDPDHDYSYIWDVTSPVPTGKKWVRVECFRETHRQHYSYHEINFETEP